MKTLRPSAGISVRLDESSRGGLTYVSFNTKLMNVHLQRTEYSKTYKPELVVENDSKLLSEVLKSTMAHPMSVYVAEVCPVQDQIWFRRNPEVPLSEFINWVYDGIRAAGYEPFDPMLSDIEMIPGEWVFQQN